MIDHDKNVGEMLDLLDELGIADNTFVMYSSDNGPHMNTWPDGAHDAVPQREEHQLGRRLPRAAAGALAREDRGRQRVATRSSSTMTGCRRSWPWPAIPTASNKLKKGATVNGKKFKNHIDGYNLLPYLTGEEKERPRKFFFYFSDDGDVLGIRYDNWKLVFMEQRCRGTMQIWAEPFTRLRLPKIFNLRMDPYERADITSNTYYDWCLHNMYFIYAAQMAAAKFVDDVQGLPAGAEAGQLHHRRRAGEDGRSGERELTDRTAEQADVKEWLIAATEVSVTVIDAMALVVIVVGTVIAFVNAVKAIFSPADAHERHAIWLHYARWLVAGLTFQLAADIIESSIAMTWEAVGRLAAIAVIRTFLNYFLERDVAELRERERERAAEASS